MLILLYVHRSYRIWRYHRIWWDRASAPLALQNIRKRVHARARRFSIPLCRAAANLLWVPAGRRTVKSRIYMGGRHFLFKNVKVEEMLHSYCFDIYITPKTHTLHTLMTSLVLVYILPPAWKTKWKVVGGMNVIASLWSETEREKARPAHNERATTNATRGALNLGVWGRGKKWGTERHNRSFTQKQ